MKTRFAIGLAAVASLGLALGAGCNKPKEEDCRRAIDNIRRLAGTDKLLEGDNIDAWVRRCRGASKKETVQCAIAAQTLEQLKACNIPVEAAVDPFASGSGSGSASASGSGSGSAKASGSGSAAASGSGSASAAPK